MPRNQTKIMSKRGKYANVRKRKMSKPVIDGTPKHKARSNKTILQLSADMTEGMEEAYRKTVLCEISHQEHVNRLLPIKVKGKGLINRTAPKQIKDDASVCSSDLDNKQSAEDIFDDKPNEQQVVSLAEILLKRDEEIREKQFFIGTTCAAILENPEARIENIGVLLDLLNEVNRDGSINFLPVRKTAMISLVEVFKDIVPEYRIGIVDKEHQKLKKDTLARVNFENKLLTYYKQLLKHIEGITSKYTKKLLRSEKQSVETRQLLEMAVQCMCDLVLAHPYFNYSPNLVQVLVLMLNNTKETIRKMVHTCFSVLFKTDARLDLTQHVSFKKGEKFVVLHHVSFFFQTVRHINMLIKKKQRNVFPEMISCLKNLQIHRINMNDDKLLEVKKQKLEKQKSYVINMSRKERKRKKKLQELEKDIFETKAEESKQIVRRKLTEISKLTFMIYFKILKCYPDSKVLSATLEGLSKFAHTINIDFFADLVELLNNLLENVELGYREQLHCIQTVFIILSGQGEVLNIDPARFYSHFYKNLLYVNAGKNHDDMQTIIKTLDVILFKRRRNVTYHRYVSFVKRLASLCLQVLPNGCLGLISLIRSCMHMNQQLDILLDSEAVVGSGKFDPFTDEPEFANANCTALFESSCLVRHYHPLIRKMVMNVLKGSDSVPINSGRTLTPDEYYTNYDCTEMVFNPEIAPPSQVKYGKNYQRLVGSKILKRKTLSKLSLRMKDGTVIGKSKEGSKGLFHDYFMDYIQMSKMKKTSLPDN
ncbi:nucleolar complex protein 3 homolog isoform X1 [Anopheles gambiae]|uniref:nucleolar complex protein 3 homolog isoform X1 n=1 Tax=Anopheles gambiae TaxID=7165 RepID=UPI002AC9A85B|nr:nucleolar complex protein 3 homolog isoform X1 [Anopheles gambiae]